MQLSTNQVRVILALMVIGSSMVMGFMVVAGLATKDAAMSTTIGIVIGNAFAEVKIILARYFPSGDSEQSKQPENK